MVSTADDVDELVSLISRPSRQADVIVCSLPDGAVDVSQSLVSARSIHIRTLGAAHVVVLTGPASYHLTDRMGKDFSVFRGAVRTYRSGFNLEQDEPFRHPLCLPNRIAAWAESVEGFERFLLSQALAPSVSITDSAQRLKSFSMARQMAQQGQLELQRAAKLTDRELLAIGDEDIGRLRQPLVEQRAEFEQLLAYAEQERR